MKTTWNLELLYKSPEDPQIEKDIKLIVSACKKFEKKWKGTNAYFKSDKILAEALKDYAKLYETIGQQKPSQYFHLLNDTQLNHPTAKARLMQIEQSMTEAWNRIIFFDLELAKIPPKDQKKFLSSAILKQYRYHLEKIFKSAKYELSESEQKILNLTEQTSYEIWTSGVKKMLSEQKILFGGKEMGMSEAAGISPSLPREDRENIYNQIIEATKRVAPFAESEMNAVLTIKKIKDDLKGYKHPYSSSILSKQNDEKAIIRFSKIVTNHFPIAHRFYALKKKMLGMKEPMRIFDVSADPGKVSRKFSFDESVKIVRAAFASIDPQFVEVFDSFLQNGQIDAFPRLNKRAGGYCASSHGLPTFILLNHTENFDSVRTLAHEMGHAFHAEFSRSQPAFYESCTLSTAEVASTFFENVAFDKIFETLSEEEKIIALHDKVSSSLASVFLQIAGFNFEVELHETLRKEGFVSKEKMSELMLKHRASYFGSAAKLDRDDGLLWVRWQHMRYYFYVYTYAYGELISSAMYAKYKEDKSFVKKLKQFLSAGGSDTPENIFKSIGIDTTKDEFWIAGIKNIEADVIKLEKLVNKNTKKNK
ncbi:MAG: hypothetical protein JWM20_126 [Patescibacteria group bacterium]|nr:hypothetical protein [Patescibacteria group bacterium]